MCLLYTGPNVILCYLVHGCINPVIFLQEDGKHVNLLSQYSIVLDDHLSLQCSMNAQYVCNLTKSWDYCNICCRFYCLLESGKNAFRLLIH